MGSYFSFYTKVSDAKKSTRHILINQAVCYSCHSRVVDKGTCSCGNVTVFGGSNELGRQVRDHAMYSDCSLIEYRP